MKPMNLDELAASELSAGQRLLAAAKEMILSTDELGFSFLTGYEEDAFERCYGELREALELFEGRPWEELAIQAKRMPYHVERENWRTTAEQAELLALQAENAAREKEDREKTRRERQFLKTFLAGGERPRDEVYDAIREAFPEWRGGSMGCFASSWTGIAKRKEAGVWYWRLKVKG
jgi:hypothetical protein